LLNASDAYGAAHDWPTLLDILSKLESLTKRCPENAEVVLRFIKGLAMAILYLRIDDQPVLDLIRKLHLARPRLVKPLPPELEQVFAAIDLHLPKPNESSA
jgi:hypothetical protein